MKMRRQPDHHDLKKRKQMTQKKRKMMSQKRKIKKGINAQKCKT